MNLFHHSVRLSRPASRLLLETLEDRTIPATITVTGTGNNVAVDGLVTLREAITSVNNGASVNADVLAVGAYGTNDTINFNIAGGGVKTISLALAPPSSPGALPTITKTVTIDGFSQPGSSFNNPLIELNGTGAPGAISGLTLSNVSNCLIRGLIINRCAGNGILITGALSTNNRIQGNFIGSNATGTAGFFDNPSTVIVVEPSQQRGVTVQGGATGNFIGTDGDGVNDATEGNLISGNAEEGVTINGVGTSGNRVAGNLIGTDKTGTFAVPNKPTGGTGGGVGIGSGATNNIVGTNSDGVSDALEANTISGNGNGLSINGATTLGNRVQGNFIGTNPTGTTAIPNLNDGITISNATNNIIGTNGDGVNDAAERNIISGNSGLGIRISVNSSGNRVAGNYIGVDVTGNVALGNVFRGISIETGASFNIIGTNGDGVSDALEGNVISATATTIAGFGQGVSIAGSTTTGNRVAGNKIGTNAAGTVAFANVAGGVQVASGSTNNIVGTNGDGLNDALEANVISGNASFGVRLVSAGTAGNRVAGNRIGTNAAGTAALPNNGLGVLIDGGAAGNIVGTNGDGSPGDSAEGNIISGNVSAGVRLTGTGTSNNRVAGNFIGTDATSAALPNNNRGVLIDTGASDNTIGGTFVGAGNVIAFNNGAGVVVGLSPIDTSVRNTITRNSIFQNVGIGIDLADNGVTLNDPDDADTGPNNFYNFPVLTEARVNSGFLQLTGFARPGAVLELFIADPDPTGFGEGRTYLITLVEGSAADLDATTGSYGPGPVNGLVQGSDTTNRFRFIIPLTSLPGVVAGTVLTSTATSPTLSTSEFSGNATVTAAPTVTLTGTVFEDANYGGGLGRSQGASGGIGRPNATVELYDVVGNFVTTTTTDGNGVYTFSGIPGNTVYFVRVVNGTVTSSRPGGATPGLFAVQTYRTDVGTGVTGPLSEVGGAVPSAQDSGPKMAGGNLNDAAVEQSVTAVLVATGVTSVAGLDFGFNFDTIVNVNDAGQGSLRQFITNSNALLNAGLDQADTRMVIPAGAETSIFMIPGAGVKTINPTSALPAVTDNTTWIDGFIQAGSKLGAPLIQLNGSGAGGANGLMFSNSSNSLIRGLVVNRFGASGIVITGGANNRIQSNFIGTNTAGIGDLGNGGNGVLIQTGATNNLVGGPAGQGNIIAFNAKGVVVGSSITDTSVDNIISQNSIFQNDALGIDLANNGVTLNDPGDADMGPNKLHNFPILAAARIVGGTLELTGFARPGSVIELFIADPDPSGFGEGKTYLITLVEGAANDLDGTIGSYGPAPVNGIPQGSDITNRFRFLIPLTALPGVGAGTLLTATATSPNPSTSEFSGLLAVAAFPATSSLAGSVYIDSNNNGLRDPGEMAVPGATVTLTGVDVIGNPVSATVITDANGNYRFIGMIAGTYALIQRQPPFLLDGRDRIGSLGGTLGNDIITNIPVGVSQGGTNYEFGELGLTLNMVSKYWLLSSTDLSVLFGPPGSGVTTLNGTLPQPQVIVGTGSLPSLLVTQTLVGSTVQVYDPASATPRLAINPFTGYGGAIRYALGDINRDGVVDILVATAESSSHVKVFDGATGAPLRSFIAFDGFTGGVSLASGDVDGDGFADIIVATARGVSHVKVFSGQTGALISSFLAFDGFTGSVQVVAGDSNGDGRADIAVSPMHGSSHVKIFDGLTAGLMQSFMAFPGFTGDIVIAFDPQLGLPAALYVGTATTTAHVKAFGSGVMIQSFNAYPGFPGGARLAVGDVNADGQSEVLTLAAGTNHEKVFSNGTMIDSFLVEAGVGVDVAESLLWFGRQRIF